MAWRPGSGHSISVGRDAIMGMGQDSYLSQDLINILNQKNIYLLFQASRVSIRGSMSQSWVHSVELGLEADFADEWDSYRRHLIDSGIKLVDMPDELIWTGGDKSGQITVKNVYEALSNKIWNYKIGGWRRIMWTWDCPLKLKLFVWLSVENKILTWKNLQKRGWQGPGMCYLCRQQRETINHIFVSCVFTITVWEEFKKVLKFNHGWNGNSLVECFQNWASQNSNYQALPAFICWNIWMDRNKSLFEDMNPSVQCVVYIVLGSCGLEEQKIQKFLILGFPLHIFL
jgi:hypothetical protein